MRKSILVGMTTLAISTLAMSLFAVAAITGHMNIPSAYANPDLKQKSYTAGPAGGSISVCLKHSDFLSCKDAGNINKDARQVCETAFDTKCKMRH